MTFRSDRDFVCKSLCLLGNRYCLYDTLCVCDSCKGVQESSERGRCSMPIQHRCIHMHVLRLILALESCMPSNLDEIIPDHSKVFGCCSDSLFSTFFKERKKHTSTMRFITVPFLSSIPNYRHRLTIDISIEPVHLHCIQKLLN